ncbi:MAG: flagellar biosynthesis protein FlhB [Proteobacteria bacterium]|nr:flagellar biosynthesis protein FlhB [Pseudomonadota bacterium]
MSDDSDPSQKTEQPTHQRLEKAREKGQIAYSKEVGTAAGLGAIALLLGGLLPQLITQTKDSLALYFERATLSLTDPHAFQSLIKDACLDLAYPVGICGAILLGVGIACGFLQTRFLISTQNLKPKFEKFSPIKGFKRIFGMNGIAEFLKTFLKLVMVAVVTYMLLRDQLKDLDTIASMNAFEQLIYLTRATSTLLIYVTCLALVVAGLDFFYQKFQFMKQMRMSHQDIKDEHKESEGDPHVKAKVRQLRQERAKKRLAQEIVKATVVITNPTHFAVALSYDEKSPGAPILVAKGVDHLALHIRKLAKDADVPIMEEAPLARALYANVKEGDEIPMEYYEAVAKIMRHILKIGLNKKTRS